MQAEAKGQGLDVSIAAYPLNKALEHVDTADVPVSYTHLTLPTN